ncbi:hypothetical protein MKK84_03395, partial [Methylobacterium sp. E-065]|uniref:hypothetical protein n=1 Tax=Methylobacterium sp. E-065 TaxID=2836583 RepID=UPI001FB91B26
SGDANLIALAPEWEAARDLYAQRIQEQIAVSDAAQPRPSRDQPHADWARQAAEWRERTGVEAAEEASAEALNELCEIEDRIAELPAASLAGLRLKALVAQRNDDIDVAWPENLGPGFARDVLAFTETQADRQAPIAPNLVGMLDLASASMGELQSIRDAAERVGSVAYVHAWSPRCRDRVNASGAPHFNAAGKLVQWVGDALTAVETAAEDEARRRTPEGQDDRETRLSMLAVSTIDNGDPAATEALARELLAHVEAERVKRRWNGTPDRRAIGTPSQAGYGTVRLS